MLRAPGGAASRFAIYRRHYRESLTRHIRGRFPTVEWLLGSPRMMALTEAFTRATPPAAPCMAEYGAEFIDFASRSDEGRVFPYLGKLAQLDWHLGDIAVAIDLPAASIAALQDFEPETLPDLVLVLQPGLRHLEAEWPVDDLVRIRLSERPPEQLAFDSTPVAIEVRGARGRFALSRLNPAVLQFRAALGQGAVLGDAMQRGAEADPQFDISQSLAALFAEGLVVAVTTNNGGERHV